MVVWRGTFLLRGSRPAAGEVVWAAIRDFLGGYGAFSGAGERFWMLGLRDFFQAW